MATGCFHPSHGNISLAIYWVRPGTSTGIATLRNPRRMEEKEPGEILFPGGKGAPRARATCPTQPHSSSTGSRVGFPHPVQIGLIPVKEHWLHQHPSSGSFPWRAGMVQLKWGRFSYLGFHQNIPKELPGQRQAGKIHYNHRQQTGIRDQPSLPREFCISAQALEWHSRIL